MGRIFLRVKGIIKKGETYLVLKHWMDDRIPDPYAWEFIDGEVQFGERPDDAMLRLLRDVLGVDGCIERILYTWSNMLGDTQCVGISYLCRVDAPEDSFVIAEDFGEWEWIPRSEFEQYVQNSYVLKDLEGVDL